MAWFDLALSFLVGAVFGTIGDYFVKEPLKRRLDKWDLRGKLRRLFHGF